MIKPEFRTTTFRRRSLDINKALEYWLVKYVVGPIIFIIPISILNCIITDDDLIKKLPFKDKILEYQIPFIIILIIMIILSKVFYSIIREYSKPNSQVAQDELCAILEALNTVVSSKNERFLNGAKNALKYNWKPTKIFQEITQPEQQIVLIIIAIQSLFEILLKQNAEIRVGLMEIKNRKPSQWFTFAPKETPPKTGPDTLSAPTSAIMRAVQENSIIVIEDIQKELLEKNKKDRKCIKGSTSKNENGSLITIPINCPNTRETIYVLSIKSDKEKSFLETERKKYKWIFNNIFLTRIILEHHLLLMKGGV